MRSEFNSKDEAEQTMKLCLGRIFRMGARPTQDGDLEEYERCKWLFMDAAEFLGIKTDSDPAQHIPNTNFGRTNLHFE